MSDESFPSTPHAVALLESTRLLRVRELFESVVQLEDAERSRVLDEERSHAPDIVAEVVKLLTHDTTSVAFLDRAVSDVAQQVVATHEAAAQRGDAKPNSTRLRPPSVPGFDIVREVGRGGMGVVYEALQHFPQRLVAIKVIRQEFATPQATTRFLHEAGTLAKLEHPGIARLYGAGFLDDEHNVPYLVMELIEGRSLREWMKDTHPRATIIEETGQYMHVEFRSRIFGFVDDVEFLVDDRVIQVRSASRVGRSDLGVNRKRIEALRLQFNEPQP